MIKFIHTQYNGDATSNYDIEFPEGMTIKEFVTQVRKEHPNEWFGDFYLNGFNSIGEYRNEYLKLAPEAENFILKRVWANGGWGCMSYFFYTEDKDNGN